MAPLFYEISTLQLYEHTEESAFSIRKNSDMHPNTEIGLPMTNPRASVKIENIWLQYYAAEISAF